jgi:hypothetical protein
MDFFYVIWHRFWKMATTFTGLKLQGQLGKFGRIEISDISAYVELPDGKVLSGTEWGNMLLWDGGFIKVEISRKGKKFCHNVSRMWVNKLYQDRINHLLTSWIVCTCSPMSKLLYWLLTSNTV